VAELLNPPAAKVTFQQDCLADCLWNGIASERVAQLIGKMIEASCQGQLPAHLLDNGAGGAESSPQLSEWYDNASVFRETDVLALQASCARENENNRLKTQRGIRRWIGV